MVTAPRRLPRWPRAEGPVRHWPPRPSAVRGGHDRDHAGHAVRTDRGRVRRQLGPPEYFMLMLLAFTTVSAVLGKSTVRGLTALFLGLAIGLVGLDQISGQVRYTGGIPEFMDGIEVMAVACSLSASVSTPRFYEGRSELQLNTMGTVHGPGRSGGVPGWPGCAARRWASWFGTIPRAAPRSRPFLRDTASSAAFQQAPGGVWHHWGDRGCRGAGSGQQCRRDGHTGAVADLWGSRRR